MFGRDTQGKGYKAVIQGNATFVHDMVALDITAFTVCPLRACERLLCSPGLHTTTVMPYHTTDMIKDLLF